MEAVMSGSDIVILGAPEAFYIPAQQISLCASKQLFHIIDAKDNTGNLLCVGYRPSRNGDTKRARNLSREI